MQRLRVAEHQLRIFMADLREDVTGIQPEEVAALACVRECLALLKEAEFKLARAAAVKAGLRRPATYRSV